MEVFGIPLALAAVQAVAYQFCSWGFGSHPASVYLSCCAGLVDWHWNRHLDSSNLVQKKSWTCTTLPSHLSTYLVSKANCFCEVAFAAQKPEVSLMNRPPRHPQRAGISEKTERQSSVAKRQGTPGTWEVAKPLWVAMLSSLSQDWMVGRGILAFSYGYMGIMQCCFCYLALTCELQASHLLWFHWQRGISPRLVDVLSSYPWYWHNDQGVRARRWIWT